VHARDDRPAMSSLSDFARGSPEEVEFLEKLDTQLVSYSKVLLSARLRSTVSARDLVQDAWAWAASVGRRLPPDEGHAVALLKRVIKNLCLNLERKAPKRLEVEFGSGPESGNSAALLSTFASDAPGPPEVAASRERQAMLRTFVFALDVEEREALVRTVLLDVSLETAARTLGVSKRTLCRRRDSAIARVRKRFAELDRHEEPS